MLKKYLFVFVAFAALCAWGIAPNWSEVSARSLNQSIPIEGTAPEDDPTNPDAIIPEGGDNGVLGPIVPDQNIGITIRPERPIFQRNQRFSFFISAWNKGQHTLNNIVIRFVVPQSTSFALAPIQAAAVGDFTCQNGGVAEDVCAYESNIQLVPGETSAEVEVPFDIDAAYPDVGIDPLTLFARVDGENMPEGLFNTARTATTVVDEEITLDDENVPSSGDEDAPAEVMASDPNSEDAAPTTVDAETGLVSVPVVFENLSDSPFDNALLTAQLPAGAVLAAGSPWSCNENGVCTQNVGTVAAGDSASSPFVYSNSLSVPISYENTSDEPQDDVTLTAQLPEGAELVPDSLWTCDENGACTQNVGTVAAGDTVSQPFAYTGSNNVSEAIPYENTSDEAEEDVTLTAQLPEGATLAADSPWTCDDSGTCTQNIGTVAPGEIVDRPFVYIGNNIQVGDEVTLDTRLDAQLTAEDGTVTPIALLNTITTEVEAPQPTDTTPGTPTGLEDTDEPVQNQQIFLPFIQTN